MRIYALFESGGDEGQPDVSCAADLMFLSTICLKDVLCKTDLDLVELLALPADTIAKAVLTISQSVAPARKTVSLKPSQNTTSSTSVVAAIPVYKPLIAAASSS